jgi:hypothetical protein
MDVCLRFSVFVLFCLGSCLETGGSLVQGVLTTVYKDSQSHINCEWEQAGGPNPAKDEEDLVFSSYLVNDAFSVA